MITRQAIAAVSLASCILLLGCSQSTQKEAAEAKAKAERKAKAAEEKATVVELADAISKNLVKFSASGDGLESVNVTLESLSDDLLKISIVPGTIFEPGSRGTQNMVVRHDEERRVGPDLRVLVQSDQDRRRAGSVPTLTAKRDQNRRRDVLLVEKLP